MPLTQMNDFTFKHSDQLDAIYTEYTANQIKSLFDSRGVELRTALNLLITALSSTNGALDIGTTTIQDVTGANIQDMLQNIRDRLKSIADGSSGADYINVTPISGVTGNTVQALLEGLKSYTDAQTASDIEATPISANSGNTVQAQLAWLLSQIAIAATGSIPDGSLTEVKLAQALIDKINTALSNTGVLTTLLTTDKSSLVNALNEHLAENATLTTKGHVQLQTTVDDTEIKALTPKALNVHASDNTKHLPTGGNVGQFLQKTSDGFSFADVPKMQLISSVTLSSQTAQIDFANIPTGYKKLRLEIIAKSTKTSIDNMVIKINDDASLVYDSELMWGYYANIYATTYYSYSGFMLYNSLSSASGDACYSEVNITNVPTEVKQMQSRTLARNMNSQTGLYFAHTMGQYKNNVEINKVSLLTSSSTIYFDIGSIFRLWGEK
jgi:hypothetical protein